MAVFGTGAPNMVDRLSPNSDYWVPKLDRNTKRDLEQTALLQRAGWSVVRIWEHLSLDEAVSTVSHALKRGRPV